MLFDYIVLFGTDHYCFQTKTHTIYQMCVCVWRDLIPPLHDSSLMIRPVMDQGSTSVYVYMPGSNTESLYHTITVYVTLLFPRSGMYNDYKYPGATNTVIVSVTDCVRARHVYIH